MRQKDIREKMYDGFIHEYNRISNEIIKTQRLINDIHEYLEVGQFFSALEVKYCPSCNHQVVHSDKEPKIFVHYVMKKLLVIVWMKKKTILTRLMNYKRIFFS